VLLIVLTQKKKSKAARHLGVPFSNSGTLTSSKTEVAAEEHSGGQGENWGKQVS